ncbi:muts domain V-domain-containing protein [Cubamyces lactineus]|nr:muts domain V-domain-containing protein [Cubamyces lactineus]
MTAARRLNNAQAAALQETVRVDTAEAHPKTDSQEVPTPPVTKRRKRQSKAQNAAGPTGNEATLPSTPLATEILDNLTRYPHCILLTRVGQFYESYFDQAAEVARLLNIKLVQRTWGGQRILMCGFPLMHLNKYLKVLVQEHNRFVAMCEEFARDPALGAKGGFDRRVVRIVTPGTLIDEPFLVPYENNYLLSVVPAPPSDWEEGNVSSLTKLPIGLAWIDVSTGEFYTKSTILSSLKDELVRISPKEVVLDQRLARDGVQHVRDAIVEEGFFVSWHTSPEEPPADDVISVPSATQASPDDLTSIQMIDGLLPVPLSDEETKAVELLTAFMHANLMEHMPSLSTPTREVSSGRMQIDSHTVKSLEIREGLRDGGTTGSLLSVIKRTVTTSGTRLLARWLCSPSTSLSEINARQSLVAFFHEKPYLRQDLVQVLRDAGDATRIVQKFMVGRGSTYDLFAICTTVDIWTSIKDRISMERKMLQQEGVAIDESKWSSIDALMNRMGDLSHLAQKIRMALTQREAAFPSEEMTEDLSTASPPAQMPRNPLGITDWSINPEFSERLTHLHAALKKLLAKKDKLEHRLQATYEAPSLTLRASPGQGMHVHVARKSHAYKLRDSEEFAPISESGSTCSFFHKEWAQLAAKISDTTFAISMAEKEAFGQLRHEVTMHASTIRRNARIIDELDVTLGFANLAASMHFVRPIVKEGTSYHVVNGRHPTVELGLLTSGRGFTPNTVTFTPDSRLHVITGPNMAGKSTLLRQTALIAILAQTGSFVPADYAEVGIVDRVFSRIGAKDDLFRDRSTFMVEMLEAGDILRRATPNSLVIMDEVGRGTTVEDGLAIAFATAHHLLAVNGCRAMFATHFHELADMLGYDPITHKGQGPFSDIAFYCTDVDEIEDGYFTYSHRLRPGVNRDSHGLKVAQLAGMPEEAIQVARTALSWLKERSAERSGRGVELRNLGQALVTDRT